MRRDTSVQDLRLLLFLEEARYGKASRLHTQALWARFQLALVKLIDSCQEIVDKVTFKRLEVSQCWWSHHDAERLSTYYGPNCGSPGPISLSFTCKLCRLEPS